MNVRLLVLLIALLATPAVAQPLSNTSPALPRVIAAAGNRPDGTAGLGDRLTLRVSNMGTFLTSAGGCKGVVLFLSDMAVPNLPPETCDTRTGSIAFFLDRKPDDDANNQAWHNLLGRPHASVRRIRVSVGTANLAVIPTDVQAFPLFVVPRAELAIFFGLLAAFVALVVVLSGRTSLIRRAGRSPTGSLAPYSLSKTQQLFWTVLVLGAYLFLWVVTGEVDTLTGSVLALLGVSTGTTLAAWMIDSSRPSSGAVSRGFLTDILSAGDGLEIQRLQAAAWTVIVGVIFCVTVYRTLFMPLFSSSLIALLGISAGTYVGFKLPEGTRRASARQVLAAAVDRASTRG